MDFFYHFHTLHFPFGHVYRWAFYIFNGVSKSLIFFYKILCLGWLNGNGYSCCTVHLKPSVKYFTYFAGRRMRPFFSRQLVFKTIEHGN